MRRMTPPSFDRFSAVSEEVRKNLEHEKNSSEFFAVEGRLMPPFEVRLSASLLIVEVFETSPILLIEVLINLF